MKESTITNKNFFLPEARGNETKISNTYLAEGLGLALVKRPVDDIHTLGIKS